jgi:hypothetical protein
MIRTNSLYEVCQELFAGYPIAVESVDDSGASRSMILMLRDGDEARFFVLSTESSQARTSFSVFPWRSDGLVNIEPDGGIVPDVVAHALMRGIPIPRDGSLFGWVSRESVTALIGVNTRYTPAAPVPSWAVMPRASLREVDWPPFASEHLFGTWFWEYYRAGEIVWLDGLIAETTGLVLWVNTTAILGSDCCVVARDIKKPGGYTLRHGCYVDCEALRAAQPVPSLARLLADPDKIDLGPLFRKHAPADYRPPGAS